MARWYRAVSSSTPYRVQEALRLKFQPGNGAHKLVILDRKSVANGVELADAGLRRRNRQPV